MVAASCSPRGRSGSGAGEVRRHRIGDDRATPLGSVLPFKRLERLQANLGIPLPEATQWELIEEAADPLQATVNELVRQAAQGEDTAMRSLL